MNEYNPYEEEQIKPKRKKKAKLKPQTIFGIFCGTFLLFIVSFLLSYMLMNHNMIPTDAKDLAQENKDLKERIESLEKKLEKYEDSDDFSSEKVPDEYTGATIVPGGSEDATSKEDSEEENSKSDKKDADKKDTDEEESAFHGIINDDEIPANTGISDAPVELN